MVREVMVESEVAWDRRGLQFTAYGGQESRNADDLRSDK